MRIQIETAKGSMARYHIPFLTLDFIYFDVIKAALPSLWCRCIDMERLSLSLSFSTLGYTAATQLRTLTGVNLSNYAGFCVAKSTTFTPSLT
jgi:hypothetical protein